MTSYDIALGHHLVFTSTCGLQPAYARKNANPASSLTRFLLFQHNRNGIFYMTRTEGDC